MSTRLHLNMAVGKSKLFIGKYGTLIELMWFSIAIAMSTGEKSQSQRSKRQGLAGSRAASLDSASLV